LSSRGPANKLGTFAKVFFATQAAVQPPTIVLVVNRPKLFTPNYQRYLLNRLRESLPFEEVPIRLIIKGRSRSERRTDEELAMAAASEPAEAFDRNVDELFEG
jgi:GTP-binding protein